MKLPLPLVSRRPAAAFLLVSTAAWSSLHGSCEENFRRADYDGDARVRINDPILIFEFLFRGGPPPNCDDAADANDDGGVDISDGVFLLGSLFLGSPAPPDPGLDCGADPSPDALGCHHYPSCEQDDDIDTDSDPENCGDCGRRCADLGWPNVSSYDCLGGTCVIAACDERYFDVDGITENGCEFTAFEPCDDGNPCTGPDFLIGGICGGTPRNCSHLDSFCSEGVCEAGECVKRARRVNIPCDDGDPDTIADRCTDAGECAGIRFP